jgi:glycosyltransferase involved in cell wall biosynthesis
MQKILNELSVFFPCYNEEDNIEQLLQKALTVVPKVAKTYEIVVINDGSKDATSEIAKRIAKKHKAIRVVDQKNSGGYGGAIKGGFNNINYEWAFFTDADLQFDLSELEKFVNAVDPKTDDLIIGYRIKRAEGMKRFILAKGMKYISSVLLRYPLFIKDTDCAFKLIKKEVIDSVKPLYSNSNLITTEFLLKAYKKKYSFKQIGVNHYCRVAGISKCGGLEDVFKVIRDIMFLMKIFYYYPLRTTITAVVGKLIKSNEYIYGKQ